MKQKAECRLNDDDIDESFGGDEKVPPMDKSHAATNTILNAFWFQDTGGIDLPSKNILSDDKGILYYIGTHDGSANSDASTPRFKNPALTGYVSVECPFIAANGAKAEGVAGRDAKFFYKTVPTDKPWFEISLGAHRAIVTQYRLSYPSGLDTARSPLMTEWKLTAGSSKDSKVVLSRERVSQVPTAKTFRVAQKHGQNAFNTFRFTCTAKTKTELVLPRVEFFGVLDPVGSEDAMSFERSEQLDWWDSASGSTNGWKVSGKIKKRPDTATMNNSVRSFSIVRGHKVYTRGKHKVSIKIHSNNRNGHGRSIEIGLVNPSNIRANRSNQYISRQRGIGWAYIGVTGQTCAPGRGCAAYGAPYSAGNVIGVEFDLSSGDVWYWLNGKRLNKAFSNVKPPVVVAVAGIYKNVVQILEEKKTHQIGSSKRATARSASASEWAARARDASLLDASTGWYGQSRSDVEFEGIPALPKDRPSADELDFLVSQQLWAVLRSSRAPAVSARLAKNPRWVRLLVDLARERSTSTARQTLALRVLRRVVPRLDTELDTEALGQNGREFITGLLDRIGAGSIAQRGFGGAVDDSRIEGPDAQGAHPQLHDTLASELGSLVRTLLRCPSWAKAINTLVQDAIATLLDVRRTLQSAQDDASVAQNTLKDAKIVAKLSRVAGVLTVLSGHSEPRREGARIVMATDGEVLSGTVLRIEGGKVDEAGDGKAEKKSKSKATKGAKGSETRSYHIILDNGDMIVESDGEKLDFVPDVSLSGSQLDLTRASLDSLIAFIRSDDGEEEEGKEKSSSSENATDTTLKTTSQLKTASLAACLHAQALKAVAGLVKRGTIARKMLEAGLGPALRPLALGICDTFEDFDRATSFNLEGLSMAVTRASTKLTLEQESQRWVWPYQGVDIDSGDTGGILYFLATDGYKNAWTNPHDAKIVTASASSLGPSSRSASAVVGRTAVRCVTRDATKQWFQVDLGSTYSALPTHYTLRHYSSAGQECLRHWKFLGSNDGKRWLVLTAHSNDTRLKERGQCATWEVPNPNSSRRRQGVKGFRYFRVLQTGPNSNKTNYLALSGFEIYGSLFRNGKKMKRPDRGTGAARDEAQPGDQDEMDKSGFASKSGFQGDECWCFGTSNYGMLPIGATSPVKSPVQIPVEALSGERIVQVACFYMSVIACTESGRCLTWGYGQYGSLGHGSNVNQTTPRFVESLDDHRIVMVGSGEGYTAALTEDGSVFMAGDGSYGQLGQGDTQRRQTHVQVKGALESKHVVRFGCGGYHILAQTSEGEVYGW